MSGATITCGGQTHTSGSGSGGSIRLESDQISLNTVTVNGGSTYAVGGKGRIAIYYFTSLTGYNCTSGNSCYAQNSSPTATPSPTSAGPTPTPSRTPTGIAPSLINYSYTDSSHVHAVTNLSNGNHYTYDLNGNMTQRTVNGVTWNIMYDAENHTQSLGNGSYSATYLYDGDGVRVGQTVNGVSTYYFAGGAYEVTVNGSNTSIRKYYSIAGQMVAMDDGSLHYLLTDHLGSVVAVASSSGVLESQQRYLPFEEPRNTPGITQTDFGFTGQKVLLGTGLMDFRARIDDPYLNRFLQPDSIIPNLYNPQNLNRYSYVNNSPIGNSDPTGHCMVSGHEFDSGSSVCQWTHNGLDSGDSGSVSGQPDAIKKHNTNNHSAYVGSFQMDSTLGNPSIDSYTGFPGSGAPSSDWSVLGNYEANSNQIVVGAAAGLPGVLVDALIMAGQYFKGSDLVNPYSQHVSVSYSLNYFNVPRIDGYRSATLNGVNITNSSRSIVNYQINISSGLQQMSTDMFSAGPGETVKAPISRTISIIGIVTIVVRANTYCIGPCYTTNPPPSIGTGYGAYDFVP